MKSKILGLLAAGAALLAGAEGPAKADNLESRYTTVSQVWGGNPVQNVRLTDGGALSFGFNNPLIGFVSVTYTAECEVIGPTISYVAVTVLIGGAAVVPSGSDAAFCSGQGANAGGKSRHSITVMRALLPGNYTVSVKAQLFGAAVSGRLDDTTILVER